MQPGESLVSLNEAVVRPGYFEAMRIPLLEGRFFEIGVRIGMGGALLLAHSIRSPLYARRCWRQRGDDRTLFRLPVM